MTPALDLDRAERVIQFCELLKVPSGKGAGEPLVLREWQKDIIRDLYAPVDQQGRRAVRTALLSMARKNGKTALIAALVLAHLIGPEAIQNGEIFSAARDRFQASQIYKFCVQMIRLDPELETMVNIIESTKRIVCYSNGSFYQSLSSEAKSKHGFSASFIVYDEIAQAPNRELWDVLTTSTGAREEPLTLAISTMTNDPNSIMGELLDYARKVGDGIVEDATFASWIFEVPMDADIWDESLWYLANPALGDFRSLDEMRVYAERAKSMPAAEATFRNLYLNQRVDPEVHFLSHKDWSECGAEIDPSSLYGKPCYAGLDLSSTQDLTALVLAFPQPDGTIDTLAYFWTPQDRLVQKENTDKVPYPLWVRQKHMEATPGTAIRKDAVVRRLAEIIGRYDVREIAYDRHRIEDLIPFWEDEGLDRDLLVPFGQGFVSFGPAVDVLETAVLNRELRHPNSPVLTWNIANSVVVQDAAGNRKLDKSKSTGRIDGAVALAMAVRQAVVGREQAGSVYEERGVLVW